MELFEEMRKGAIISPCNNYRYELWRIWDATKPRAVFIMLNPSTADANKDDPTIRRCIAFAKSWGCGSIHVYNIFAFRTAYVSELKDALENGFDVIGPENDGYLNIAARDGEASGFLVLAWGNNASLSKKRMDEIKRILPEAKCLKVTNLGMPNHPLYVAHSTKLIKFSW